MRPILLMLDAKGEKQRVAMDDDRRPTTPDRIGFVLAMKQYTLNSAQLRVQELLTQLGFLNERLGAAFYKPTFTVAVLAENEVRAKEMLKDVGIELTESDQLLWSDIIYKELTVMTHVEPVSIAQIRGRSNLFVLVDKHMYCNENYWHRGTPAVNALFFTLKTVACSLERDVSTLFIPI